jgi:hypothetical protein
LEYLPGGLELDEPSGTHKERLAGLKVTILVREGASDVRGISYYFIEVVLEKRLPFRSVVDTDS